MPQYSGLSAAGQPRRQKKLERVLECLCAFGIPALLAVICIVGWLQWPSYWIRTAATSLAFQALELNDSSPEQALLALQGKSTTLTYDNHLSQTPVWFTFIPQSLGGADEASIVEFPSRHAIAMACWQSGNGDLLGLADRNSQVSPVLSASKTGFALKLPTVLLAEVICRAQFIGPARLSIKQWPAQAYFSSAQELQHNAGLLDGGLIVLALFVCITALINRNSLYLIFSTWLLVNLRMAALSAGWDHQWMGRSIPYDALVQARLVTCALYYTLTLVLFTTLFKESLERVGYARLVTVARWSCLPLFVLSLFASYPVFLPFMWLATGLGVVFLVFLLYKILRVSRSSVAIWYAASIVITLVASLYEVIAASFGFQEFIGTVNSVTAALASSLLASLAIAAQMRQEHDSRLSIKAELEHTYEVIPVGLFTLNLYGEVISANPAFLDMLGVKKSANETVEWRRYFEEKDWYRLLGMVKSQQDAEFDLASRQLAVPLGAADLPLAVYPRHYSIKATLADDKVEGTLQDVTEKHRATQELKFLVNHDPLTKVLNRRGIENVLADVRSPSHWGQSLALAYVDLDRFKLINDLFGHAAGDEVLLQVCRRIEQVLLPSMSVGRVGGDEFVIVMVNVSLEKATQVCQRIVDEISNRAFEIGGNAFHARGSIGLIEVSAAISSKDALSCADLACREAKGGKKGLVVYEKNAPAFLAHEAELHLVEKLSSESEIEGLFLEMQPIMSLTTPFASHDFEVLLRMRAPDGKLVPTDRLISAAENSGRMGVIDRWVLSTTLEWLSLNKPKLPHTRFVCVNLSGASLNDEKFVQDVYVMLAQHRAISEHLCLEITESVALHDLNMTRRFIDQVRQFGAKVALDDFGAGYTSFSYLRDLPSDLLKIDGRFIVNMNSHPSNIAIVEAIVSLAHNLGMKTVAEWAEDCATVETLQEIGVDYVQGYVVARPMLPEKILQMPSAASFAQDQDLIDFLHTLHPQAIESSGGLFDALRSGNEPLH